MTCDLPFLFWISKGDLKRIAYAKFHGILIGVYILNGFKWILSFRWHCQLVEHPKMPLRSYDTFRNLNLIFLKLCMRKEHSRVIFKTTKNHGVIDLVSFSKIFEKLKQFMSQTSHSPKLVSFFAIFIPSEIQALHEILFCHVGIIFVAVI